MKSLAAAVVIAGLGLLATSTSVSAQWIWLGGGAAFPVSDFGDYADTGYMVIGGLGYDVGVTGFNVGIEGSYGQNNHSDTEGDKTAPIGLIGSVGYSLNGPDADGGLYTWAGLGILWHKFNSETFEESTDAGLGLQAGAGYGFPLGSLTGWVESRITHASIEDENTTFVGALAGISIPLGD